MFKADYMLMDILANFDWKRPINFSTGGIYEDQNIFSLIIIFSLMVSVTD
jgi:hypothetical protein